MDLIGFITNNIVLFIVIMTVLVFVHEWGHYWVGIRNGIKVEVFSIGFGRELWGWTSPKTGTRWKLSLLPLGGYVKFAGDSNPSGAGAPDETLDPEVRKHAFHAQSLKVRAAVVAAGPIANLLFAVVLSYGMLLAVGQSYSPSEIVIADPAGPAAKAGLRSGDVVTSIGGRRIDSFEDLMAISYLHPEEPLALTFRRNGQERQVSVTPVARLFVDRFRNEHRVGDLGVVSIQALAVIGRVLPGSAAEQAGLKAGDRVRSINGREITLFVEIPPIVRGSAGSALTLSVDRDGVRFDLVATPASEEVRGPNGVSRIEGRLGMTSNSKDSMVRRFGPIEALGEATVQVWHMSGTIFTVLKQIVMGVRPASELSGPIGIAKATGEMSQIGWTAILAFMIGLSVTLGVFNLLPVPMLDGGHLLFYAFEWIRGKPLSPRTQEYGFRIGLAAMGSLMVFATFNDLVMLVSRALTL